MKLIFLSLLPLLVNSNWPFPYNEAHIKLHQVVCPNHHQMFVMAEKYGIPKVFHPPQNIFANPNYGYYELYICESSRHNLSSGCVHEMMHGVNFRYAHLPTLDFTFLVNNYLPQEYNLINQGQFDLCLVDATYSMRYYMWMQSQGNMYYSPNLFDRLQMPKRCWRISLRPMQMDSYTRSMMDNAITMKLAKFQNRRKVFYLNQIFELGTNINALSDRIIKQKNAINKLNEDIAYLRKEKQNEPTKVVTELTVQLNNLGKERAQLVQNSNDIKVNYKQRVEKEANDEQQKIINETANEQTPKVPNLEDIRHDNSAILEEMKALEGTYKRRKRETAGIIEKLKKMTSKKQVVLFNMANHGLLPSGSMDVDSLIEEIVSIRKENTTPENAKDINFNTILETTHDEWGKLADNAEVKEKINMIAAKKMEETVRNTLLVDYKDGIDLEMIALKQLSDLKKSISAALQKEKEMKAQGPEKYSEYRRSLFQEVEKIMESTKMEQSSGVGTSEIGNTDEKDKKEKQQTETDKFDKTEKHELHVKPEHPHHGQIETARKIGEIIPQPKTGVSEIEEVIEEDKRDGKTNTSDDESENEEHDLMHAHRQNQGNFRATLEKSGQFLKTSAEFVANKILPHLQKAATFGANKLEKFGKIGSETVEKYELKERAKSVGENVIKKSKELLERALTGGVKWAKHKTVHGAKHAVMGVDLWKASSVSEAYKEDLDKKIIEEQKKAQD